MTDTEPLNTERRNEPATTRGPTVADLNDPAESLLSLADIATELGLSPASVRTYHTDANRRRRQDASLDQDMPAPDLVLGRTPAWKRESIDRWKAEREAAAQRNLDRLRQPRGSRAKVPVT